MVLPPLIANASAEALFRYQVVAQVEASVKSGCKQLEAVRVAAGQAWLGFDGTLRRVGKRTVYRWLAAYREHGLVGLEPARRERTKSSAVLPDDLVQFVARQKDLDTAVSIPEVIRRARELGIIDAKTRVDRSTLYRVAKRMEIPVARRKGPSERDARRFAYPHRLDCVLCDGKHFAPELSATNASRCFSWMTPRAWACTWSSAPAKIPDCSCAACTSWCAVTA